MENLQLIYAGTRLVTATNGVLVFKANKNWTSITGVRLSVFSPNTFSDTQFNLKKNGDNLFTDELTIPVGEKEIDLAGLDLEVSESDEFRLDLTSTLGRVYAPIILELTVVTSGEGGGEGEANTGSNVGASGVGVFKNKVGVDLRFKKLLAGENIEIEETENDEILITSTASGGGASGWHPDEPPASPTAYDDEFPNGSLDAKWSVITNVTASGGDLSNSIINGCFVISALGSSSSPFHSTYIIGQNLPAAPYKFRCKGIFQMRNNPHGTGDLFFGLYETTGKSVSIGQEQLGTQWQSLDIAAGHGTEITAPRVTTLARTRRDRETCYFEIENNGTTVYLRYSADGKVFSNLGSVAVATVFTTAPTKLIIGGRAWQTAEAGQIAFDWVRRIS